MNLSCSINPRKVSSLGLASIIACLVGMLPSKAATVNIPGFGSVLEERGPEDDFMIVIPGHYSRAEAISLTYDRRLIRRYGVTQLVPVGSLRRWDFLAGILAPRTGENQLWWTAGFYLSDQFGWESTQFQTPPRRAIVRWVGGQPDRGPHGDEDCIVFYRMNNGQFGANDISSRARGGVILWRPR